MSITSSKLTDIFSVNRSFIELVSTKIVEMQTIKWDSMRKNIYSHIFDIGASILSIRDRIELDDKIAKLENKYNLSLRALENIVFLFSNFAPHKRVVMRVRIPKGLDGEWDKVEKKIVNWHHFENELRHILFWLNLKIQLRASALGIDFTKISELRRESPEKPTYE